LCLWYMRSICGRRFLRFLPGWPIVPFDEQKAKVIEKDASIQNG